MSGGCGDERLTVGRGLRAAPEDVYGTEFYIRDADGHILGFVQPAE
jgi:hypothetical protein